MKFLEELKKEIEHRRARLESLRELLEQAGDRNDVHNQVVYAQKITEVASELGALKVMKEKLEQGERE